MSDEVTIRCDGVSKRFARNLKRSLYYGVADTLEDLFRWEKSDRELELRQSEFWALKDVSFELKRGDSLALMGVNGSGKTTMLKILNGLLKPDIGRVSLKGRVGALIALGAGFNPILSGRENVFINGAVLGFSRREMKDRFDEIVEFAGLAHAIDAPVMTYSSGMQVRLGFSIATSIQPEILLIDEVLAVGDFNFRTRCYERLGKIMSGTTIIFVSHSIPQITRVCNCGLLLEKGKMVKEGTMEDVLLEYTKRNTLESKTRVIYSGNLTLEEHEVSPNSVEFGGPLNVSIKIHAEEKYENCEFCVIFLRNEDPLCEWVSTNHNLTWDLEPGMNTVEFDIENLRLHAGVYKLKLHVMASDRLTHIINCDGFATIETTGFCYRGIPVHL
jgi:lipopolysaccharide transport system ATP-binding protein